MKANFQINFSSLAYKISIPIYDFTVTFCKKHRQLLSSHRTYDQMIQASRSGTQNIAEGNQQASLEGYIKLTGVNRGSLEELLKDYLAFARQNRIEIWEKVRVEREANFPDLPEDLTKAVNLMLTLVNQAIYLQKRLQQSLEDKFVKEGGFREKLFKQRLEFKKKHDKMN